LAKRKKSSKCPEPFNTLIDLAGAAAFDYIANKRRQNRSGKQRKIDPYEAAGIAFGMGKLESTEDILQLGGMLGAMGAFDDDNADIAPCATTDSAFGVDLVDIFDKPGITLKQLGEAYGISMQDYATRDEFIEALNSLRFSSHTHEKEKESVCTPRGASHRICRVSDLANGAVHVGLTEDMSISPGCLVKVTSQNDTSIPGIVLSVDDVCYQQHQTLPVVTKQNVSNT